MASITTTSPIGHIEMSLLAWQTTHSTQETIPVQKLEQTLSAWQSSSSTGETLSPNQKLEHGQLLVQAPNIGVRHRSADTMPNYIIPAAPYRGAQ